MNVYLLWNEPPQGSAGSVERRLEGVFSSREKADAYVAEMHARQAGCSHEPRYSVREAAKDVRLFPESGTGQGGG